MIKGYKVEVIPEGTKVIAAKAFANRTDLSSIEIPDSVTEIGDFAFSGCTNLASIKIPNSVKKIGFSAFAGCHSLDWSCMKFIIRKYECNYFSRAAR